MRLRRPPLSGNARRVTPATPVRSSDPPPLEVSLARTLFALLVILPLASAGPADAGAWTRDAGGWFMKLGYDRWHTETRFETDGRRVPFESPDPGFDDPSEYRSDALRLYAEYGLADGLTVAGSTSYEVIEAEGRNLVRRSTGPGDVTLTLRQRLVSAPLLVSVQGHTQLPVGDTSGPGPALGSGHTDYGARLLFGGSSARSYITGGVGYTARGGTRADEIPWSIELGHAVGSTTTLRAGLDGAMTTGSTAALTSDFDPALAESGHLAGSFGLVLEGRPFDLVIEVQHVLSGENTLAGTRLSLSLWAQR